jgi:hypothetical protein
LCSSNPYLRFITRRRRRLALRLRLMYRRAIYARGRFADAFGRVRIDRGLDFLGHGLRRCHRGRRAWPVLDGCCGHRSIGVRLARHCR